MSSAAANGRVPEPRLAWHSRALFAVGFAITAGTGVGLYAAPAAVGESFAWTIRTPLTAAFIGAGYFAGAAVALALALRDQAWPRVRIVAASAFVLTSTNLLVTIRFYDEFAIGNGSAVRQLVAWTWLVVYVVLPPALVAVAVAHEIRGGGRAEWRVVREPETTLTIAAFAACAGGLLLLGLWLTIDPDGGLARAWPWRLPPVSAAVVGTWLLTLATPFAWGLAERDWERVRIVTGPLVATVVLGLAGAVRLREEFSGGAAAVACYVFALLAVLATIGGAWISQRRRRMTRPSPADDYALG